MAPASTKPPGDSPVFKWAQLVVSTILVPLIWHAAAALDEVTKGQAALLTHVAVLDEQVASLNRLVPQRNAQLAEMDSSIVELKNYKSVSEFRLTNLEAWRQIWTRR